MRSLVDFTKQVSSQLCFAEVWSVRRKNGSPISLAAAISSSKNPAKSSPGGTMPSNNDDRRIVLRKAEPVAPQISGGCLGQMTR
jgi:hypothetical protein